MVRGKKRLTRLLFLERSAGPPIEVFVATRKNRAIDFIPMKIGKISLGRDDFDIAPYFEQAEAAYQLANDTKFRNEICWVRFR